MRILPRRLFMLGGAAALAAGGFAFMASNTVSASSAGEGAAAVTGYNVTGITYTIDNHFYGPDPVTNSGFYYAAATAVTFTLTAQGTGPASTQPTNVDAYALNLAGDLQWGHDNGCSLQGSWTNGSGTYTCSLLPEVPVAELGKLVVEANQ